MLAYQVKSCLLVTEQPTQVAQYNVHIKIYHFLKNFTIILFLKDDPKIIKKLKRLHIK